jgi:hypothetical protein
MLRETVCNEASLERAVILDLEDPVCADRSMARGKFNKIKFVIEHKGVKLLLHGCHPLVMER